MKKRFVALLFSTILISSGITAIAASNYGSFGGGLVGGGSFGGGLSTSSGKTRTTTTSSYSEETKEVQELLNAAGYDCGTPDGIMGNNTRNSILNYQKDNGLSQTGEVSDELLKHLKGEMETLESEKSEQDTLVETLTAENAELKEKVSTLEAQIEELQKKIEELESDTVAKESETESSNSKTSTENNSSSSNSSSKKSKTITHTCEASGCYKEGTKSIVGIFGQTEYYCQSHYNEMEDMVDEMLDNSSSYSNEGYGYDPNDYYYSTNDHNGDGKLTDEEFQDAMGDYLDDLYEALDIE